MTTPRFAKTKKDGHRYYHVQSYGDFPSVTSIIGGAAREADELRNWKTKNAIDAAIASHETGADRKTVHKVGIEELDAVNEAAILGDAVHNAIENYERTGTQSVDDLKVAPYLAQYLDLKERYRVKVLACELTVVNLRERYAGTTDGIWLCETWPAKSRRGPVFVDVKSGKTVRKSAALQLAALSRCEHYLDSTGRLRAFKSDHKALTGVGLIAHVRPKAATLHETSLDTPYEQFLTLRKIFGFRDEAHAFNVLTEPAAGEAKEMLSQKHAGALMRIETLNDRQKDMLLRMWAWRSLKEPPTSWTLDKLDEVHAAIDQVLSHSWKLEGLE